MIPFLVPPAWPCGTDKSCARAGRGIWWYQPPSAPNGARWSQQWMLICWNIVEQHRDNSTMYISYHCLYDAYHFYDYVHCIIYIYYCLYNFIYCIIRYIKFYAASLNEQKCVVLQVFAYRFTKQQHKRRPRAQ